MDSKYPEPAGAELIDYMTLRWLIKCNGKDNRPNFLTA